MRNTSRRAFLKSTLGAAVVGPSLIISGCGGGVDRGLSFSSFDEAIKEAVRLAGLKPELPADVFSLSQVFAHCAQSIEFSMTGFPESKSAVFQDTLGSAAFSVFSWRGSMSHDVTEAIPGAPFLDSATPIDQALTRLETSIVAFTSNNGDFKPHFAYGSLSKEDYQSAHILHLANHFSFIDA